VVVQAVVAAVAVAILLEVLEYQEREQIVVDSELGDAQEQLVLEDLTLIQQHRMKQIHSE
jgi:hypothetical protein